MAESFERWELTLIPTKFGQFQHRTTLITPQNLCLSLLLQLEHRIPLDAQPEAFPGLVRPARPVLCFSYGADEQALHAYSRIVNLLLLKARSHDINVPVDCQRSFCNGHRHNDFTSRYPDHQTTAQREVRRISVAGGEK